MAQTSLYFIAILPDKQTSKWIRTLQEEMCSLFGVCKAMRTPPHITIVPPFQYREDTEYRLIQAFHQISFAPFDLPIEGLGRFGKQVIFVKPEVIDSLESLYRNAQEQVKNLIAIEKQKSFHPHFTIGYRDLAPVFLNAWKHFEAQEIPITAHIEKMVLFKHQDKRWQILTKIFDKSLENFNE
jgi:2'-5' RNA ligase